MLKRFRPAWAVVAWLIISTWPLPSNATLEDANAAIAAADYQRAYSKLVSLAETGNARAQRMLGGLHLTGLGTAKDPGRANYWFRKAAENGDRSAMFLLGQSYKFGLGVEQHEKHAFGWYLKAAKHGHLNAQHETGFRYSIGYGTQKNLNRAVHWYRKAAAKNHSLSLMALAEMYRFGNTRIPRDIRKSIALYERAARTKTNGSAHSLEMLARIFGSKEEGQFDPVSAYAFYVLSAKQRTIDRERDQKRRQSFLNKGLLIGSFDRRMKQNQNALEGLEATLNRLTQRLAPNQLKQGNHQVEIWSSGNSK